MKTNTSPADKPKEFATDSFIQLRTAILPFLIAFMLSCFGLSAKILAVVPAPDGGYPGNNTAEGTNALFSLTTGVANTATGSSSLYQNTSASYNTATGFQALVFDTTGDFNTATGAQALSNNKTGINNTAAGYQALFHN